MAAADAASLLAARFGTEQPAQDAPVPAGVASLLDRRVTRRYRDEAVSRICLTCCSPPRNRRRRSPICNNTPWWCCAIR